VVSRCLSKNPAQRFGSMGELRSALERAAAGEMPKTRAPRSKRSAIVALAAAACGAILIAALLDRSKAPEQPQPTAAKTETAAPAKTAPPADTASAKPAIASAPREPTRSMPAAPAQRKPARKSSTSPKAPAAPTAVPSGDLAAAIAERK
jgi:hypothetical protein